MHYFKENAACGPSITKDIQYAILLLLTVDN